MPAAVPPPRPAAQQASARRWTGRGLATAALCAGLVLPVQAQPTGASAPLQPGVATAPASAAPPEAGVTGAAQAVYAQARTQLLQVRTLLRTQDSQSSVGSGFLVDEDGHLVTNYHVVSQYALQPGRHRLVYATVDGRQGALQLLAFDVINDLALLRPLDPAPLAGRGSIPMRPPELPLPRGARVFALGNPLDVGFAVAEGGYNGPVERSFLQTLFFGGSLSAGMSGGPALDEQGRLVGVNVARRRDGEQVSFLVPADPVRELLARGRGAPPITEPVWPEIGRQLRVHEQRLAESFLAQPWRNAGHPRIRIPVPQETWMRCWGRGSPQSVRSLQFERSDCEMDSRVFISEALRTGYLTVAHEAYDGSRLGALRFAERYSGSFRNEFMGRDERDRTAPRCVEDTVRSGADGLPMRAVICLRGYKKLPGLHDLSVLVATLDSRTEGVQGRLDAYGLSLEGAQRLARHYLDGFAWTDPKTDSR